MNYLYNQPKNDEAVEIANETTNLVVNYVASIWEKQTDFLKELSERNVSRFFAAQNVKNLNDAVNFAREENQTELSEVQKAGESYYKMAVTASQDLMAVTHKNRNFIQKSLDQEVENLASSFGSEKNNTFSDMFRHTSKVANDVFKNGLDVAFQITRSNVENAVDHQREVASEILTATNKNGATNAKVKKSTKS